MEREGDVYFLMMMIMIMRMRMITTIPVHMELTINSVF